MQRRARIRQTHGSHIDRAAHEFRDHEDMSNSRVLHWVSNFADEDLGLAVRVLQSIRYYSGSEIRRKVRELVRLTFRSLAGVRRNKIYFIPVGSLGSGASVLARALAGTPGVSRDRIRHMLELERIPPEQIGAIVFVDDFSGTGDTLHEWWTNVEMLVQPKRARIVVGILALNYRARPRIEEFANIVIGVDELDESHNVLSPVSGVFPDPDKETLILCCAKTGCRAEFVRGYGECGLLLAFRHGCPNNSLPILWQKSATWRRLFARRGV